MTIEEFYKKYSYDSEDDLIGEGSFGRVFRAEDLIRNRLVALKISYVQKGRENMSLQTEVELAKEIPEHRNIAHYEACYRLKDRDGWKDFGILQYYPLGNMSHFIRNTNLSDAERDAIIHQLLDGLEHLHKHDIIHRDIKSGNVLISQTRNGEYVPKIADFGLSKRASPSKNSYIQNSITGGTVEYAPLEQLNGEALRQNVDLWSLGVIVYELVMGKLPFQLEGSDGSSTNARITKMVQLLMEIDIDRLTDRVPKRYRSLIKTCLIKDNNKRVSTVSDARAVFNGRLAWDYNVDGRRHSTQKKDERSQRTQPKVTPQKRGSGDITEPRYKPSARSVSGKEEKGTSNKAFKKSSLWYVLGGLAVALLGGYFLMNGSSPSPTPPVEMELRLDSLAYVQLDLEDKAALSAYIKDYKEGEYVDKAQTRLDKLERLEKEKEVNAEDLAAWEKAQRKNTKAAYELYISSFSTGKYVSQAKSMIRRTKSNTEKQLVEYKPVENEDIVKQPDEMPIFPGCNLKGWTKHEIENCTTTKIMEYVYGNLIYPESAIKQGLEGTVVIRFVINKHGEMIDINLVHGIGRVCDDAALDVVRNMKKLNIKWIPGKVRQRDVNCVYTLPIRFKLED